MNNKEFQDMLKCYPDDLVIEIDAGHNHYLRPTRCGKHFGALLIDTCKILRGYKIRKDLIKGDSKEVCPLPLLGLIDTREQAAVFLAKDVFDEIGWTMPDIKGKFAEILKEAEKTGPEYKYSFANCEWWIEEVY